MKKFIKKLIKWKKLINYADVAKKRYKNKNKAKHNLNWPDISQNSKRKFTNYRPDMITLSRQKYLIFILVPHGWKILIIVDQKEEHSV